MVEMRLYRLDLEPAARLAGDHHWGGDTIVGDDVYLLGNESLDQIGNDLGGVGFHFHGISFSLRDGANSAAAGGADARLFLRAGADRLRRARQHRRATATGRAGVRNQIGDKGERLKRIGMETRQELEKLLGAKVFIELWVKVRSGWADDEARVRSFGYE